MTSYRKFYGHLKTVVKHRWYVFTTCCQMRIPWQGFIHDLSKFSPVEFWESVKYYEGTRSPIDACKEAQYISYGWLHHKSHNKHHYEYWMDYFDQGGKCHVMPFKYALEMLCDYMGAGKAYNANRGQKFTYQSELNWWNSVKDHRCIHPIIKTFIEECLIFCVTENKLPKKCEAKLMYDCACVDYYEDHPEEKGLNE